MATAREEPRLSVWAKEGRRLALALDNLAFVVIAGSDPKAAAEVALGMGRVQAQRRRVVVADAVGLLPPIDDLVPFEATHGIADVLVRGVPLRKATHPVEGAEKMSVLPSGPGLRDRGKMLRSERWMAIVETFRESGSLLMVVVPEHEPALSDLLKLVDGVVMVGTARAFPGVRVVAYVTGPGSKGGKPTASLREISSLGRSKRPGAVARVSTVQAAAAPEEQRSSFLLVVIVLAGLAAGGGWLWHQRGEVLDGLAGESSTDSPAAAWSVRIGAATTDSAANAMIDQESMRGLPAVTFAPANQMAGGLSFQLLAGAYTDRRAADTLLASLRARTVVPAVGGAVLRLPYAVRLLSGLSRDDASHSLALLRSMGLPAYPMVQTDGTVQLYAGAFERAGDATPMVAAARARGGSPTVTVRTGSPP